MRLGESRSGLVSFFYVQLSRVSASLIVAEKWHEV